MSFQSFRHSEMRNSSKEKQSYRSDTMTVRELNTSLTKSAFSNGSSQIVSETKTANESSPTQRAPMISHLVQSEENAHYFTASFENLCGSINQSPRKKQKNVAEPIDECYVSEDEGTVSFNTTHNSSIARPRSKSPINHTINPKLMNNSSRLTFQREEDIDNSSVQDSVYDEEELQHSMQVIHFDGQKTYQTIQSGISPQRTYSQNIPLPPNEFFTTSSSPKKDMFIGQLGNFVTTNVDTLKILIQEKHKIQFLIEERIAITKRTQLDKQNAIKQQDLLYQEIQIVQMRHKTMTEQCLDLYKQKEMISQKIQEKALDYHMNISDLKNKVMLTFSVVKDNEIHAEMNLKKQYEIKASRINEFKFLQEYSKKVDSVLKGLKLQLDKQEHTEKNRLQFLKSRECEVLKVIQQDSLSTEASNFSSKKSQQRTPNRKDNKSTPLAPILERSSSAIGLRQTRNDFSTFKNITGTIENNLRKNKMLNSAYEDTDNSKLSNNTNSKLFKERDVNSMISMQMMDSNTSKSQQKCYTNSCFGGSSSNMEKQEFQSSGSITKIIQGRTQQKVQDNFRSSFKDAKPSYATVKLY